MGTGRMGSENGHDWFNPVNITLNTSQGSYPRKNYYAALYQRNQGAFANASTFLSDITGYLDIYTLSAGVLLSYGQLNGDINNNTYVWTGSAWLNISGYGSTGWLVCGIAGCTTQAYYRVYPVDTIPTWKALFYKNFLGGNLYTAVYAEDNQVPPNAAFNPDISPWLFR